MRRMINEHLQTDEYIELNDKEFRLLINMIINTDQDGFFKGRTMLKIITGASDKEFNNLIEKEIILKDQNTDIYVIRDFHIFNSSLQKNTQNNSNKYNGTVYNAFKEKLYITDNLQLTTKKENNTPYKFYNGGSARNFIKAQKEKNSEEFYPGYSP